MRTVIIFLCTSLFLIAGCAEVQRPTTEKFYFQKQLQSAIHWQSIAKEEAMRINTVLVSHGFIEEGKASPAIYISEDDKSPFGMAMRDYLLTELMTTNPALQISNDPDAPFVFAWNTQWVTRNPNRPKPFLGIPFLVAETVATLIMGGGWNTTDLSVPHTELILTSSIILNNQCLERYSDTYFINDNDWINYDESPASYYHPRSIAANDLKWKNKLTRQGLLNQ